MDNARSNRILTVQYLDSGIAANLSFDCLEAEYFELGVV